MSPLTGADAIATGLLGHVGEQPLRCSRSIARVRHDDRVLAQAVQADAVGRGHLRLLPATLAPHALVLFLPESEEAARVREELLLDLLGGGLIPSCTNSAVSELQEA